MESNPEFRFLPHWEHSEVSLKDNSLVWKHLRVKLPQNLSQEEPRFLPGQGQTGAGPRALAKGVETVSGIIPERWVP